MLKCNKCGGACADDALYCTECGNRLSTDACRKCGDYLPKEVKFCAHCGYPTKGTVCGRCGMTNPDEANFCLSCGNKLAGSVASAPKLVPSVSGGVVHEVKSAPVAAGGGTGKAAFAHNVTRAFVLPLLLMVLFISSFFGMFKVYEQNSEMELPVTGFDAVRGMFLLMNPPTEDQVMVDFVDYMMSNGINISISENNVNFSSGTGIKSLMTRFGVLRMMIYEENVDKALIMQVLTWGLISLSLMVITLVFFILSLIHAVKVVQKRAGLFKHETLPLALTFALVIGLIGIGGPLAGAAIAMLLISAAGLSAITTLKYIVEKQPRPKLIVNLRRGICAMLVVLTVCFASSGIVNVAFRGTDVKASIPTAELYSGIDNVFEISNSEGMTATEEINAKDIDEDVAKKLEIGISAHNLRLMLRIRLSPVVLCYASEALDSFGIPIKAVSWLMFFANLFFSAMIIMTIFAMLQEEANPEKPEKKIMLWNILSLVGVVTKLGIAIPYIVMGNSISKSLALHVHYGMNGLIITAAVLAIVAMITDIIMRSFSHSGKKNKNNISQYINVANEKEQTV